MSDSPLSYYDLTLANYKVDVDHVNWTTVEIHLSTTESGEFPRINELMNDVALMNTIRESSEPAVQEAFDQLLAVLALTNRDTPK